MASRQSGSMHAADSELLLLRCCVLHDGLNQGCMAQETVGVVTLCCMVQMADRQLLTLAQQERAHSQFCCQQDMDADLGHTR